MLKQQAYLLNSFRMIMDAAGIIGAGYGALFVDRFLSEAYLFMESDLFVGTVLLVMFINNYVMGRMGLYSDRKPSSYVSLIFKVFKSIIVVFSILSAGLFLLGEGDVSRQYLLCFALFSFLILSFERAVSRLYVLNRLKKNKFNLQKILVVGQYKRARVVCELLNNQESWGHEVIGVVALDKEEKAREGVVGQIGELCEMLREKPVDEVIFAINGDRGVDLNVYLNLCREMGITAKILPAMWRSKEDRITVENYQNIPFLVMKADNFNATGLLYKRVLDIVGGVVGFLILAAMYPFIALVIKYDSPGPVFFVQKRKGRQGRVFNLYKFRTMYLDADKRKKDLMDRNKMNGAMFKIDDDPRITPAGRWLRRTSLDEFPQFINVLKGEMSLVGTRPPTLEEVEQYDIYHLRRISAKPGITGLWQISGRNRITDFEEIVKLDCSYLDNWRFLDDVVILIKTVFVVLCRKGAV